VLFAPNQISAPAGLDVTKILPLVVEVTGSSVLLHEDITNAANGIISKRIRFFIFPSF
jgi:hypothetical protein